MVLLVFAAILVANDVGWGSELSRLGPLTASVLALGLVSAAAMAWIALARRWLTTAPDGFVIEGPWFRQSWRDAEIATLSYWRRPNYARSSHAPSSETYCLVITDAQGRRAKLKHTQRPGADSPFFAFVSRLMAGACSRVRDDLSTGGKLVGKGWHLDRHALRFPSGEIPLAEVSGVADFDDRLRVWRKGRKDAAFTVPLKTKNAALLARLLEELRPRDETAVVPDASLGRVRFERRGSGTLSYLGGIAVLWLGVMFLDLALAFSAGVWAFGLAFFVRGWWLKQLTFRCHERGVSYRARGETKALRYQDMTVLTFGATRISVNWVPVGTTTELELQGSDGTWISWKTHRFLSDAISSEMPSRRPSRSASLRKRCVFQEIQVPSDP